ncbi:hypothetical protein F5Y05DRAFT_228272 [Hypoxylon sp. FL0543]|nr:hypothetical protein F5Y05DRAFT_228272 [Hypoxylon sp. FL0543]
MLIQTHPIPIPNPLTITAEPLTPTAFTPFGAVLANPAPERRPHNTPASALPPGHGAVSANQGTAIQYRALAPPLRNLYDQAPSRKPATPRTTMFVCGARQLLPDPDPDTRDERKHGDDDGSSSGSSSCSRSRDETGLFPLNILERHPYTTQTFIPLNASPKSRYLVIVAPSRPPEDADRHLPAPAGDGLPGRGLPDLSRLRAFVATGAQAVTYGAGTWHAPMAALGDAGDAVDFVVVQFANDVPVEDCQEVELGGPLRGPNMHGDGEEEGGNGAAGIMIRVPLLRTRVSKL